MSIIYRSVKGSKLTSAEVDGNFQYLENLVGGAGNAITTQTGFSLVGQDLTINANWVWQILNISYTNASSVLINIPFAASGNERIDLIVANQSNAFERIAGIESASNPSAPAVPTNKIFVTFITVTDGTLSSPTPPITGSQFKQKNESRKFSAVLSGTDQVVEFRTAGHQHYAVSGSVTSVAGFGKTLLLASTSAEIPYAGKDIFFENNSGHDITLKDNFSGVDIKFSFGADLVVPSNGIVWLKYDAAAENLALFFKNWSEIDLSTKADLVGGKVPPEQLPSYVDDVEEYANLASFPVTGETSKIYLALDTNKTYRWSGSAYVQIGGGASGDIENYFVNSINWSRYITRASMSGNTYLGASLISPTGTQISTRIDSSTATIARNTVFRICIIQPISNAFSEILSPQIDKSDFQIGIFTGLFTLTPGANSTFRAFAGTSNITAFGNINPSQYLSYMFGIGCDDTDTNYQLIYGEDSSSRVKIDLGWSKNIGRIIMIKFNQTTASGNTDVYVKSVVDGLEFTASVNYRFKGGWRVWANRGNTSTIGDVNCGYSNVEINVRNDI